MRKVTKLKIHDLALVIPGIGSLGTELPSQSKTLKMTMEEGTSGVELKFEGHKLTYIIPYANIQMYFVES
jgi:hypothetical protein